MTRNDLKETFNILGENKDLALFYKDKSNCMGIGYCGNISLVNGKAVFNGKKYGDVESLRTALVEWEKSLKWPVDTYCPLTRESYRIRERVEWFLTDKLGFKGVNHNWDYVYERAIGPEFKISFMVSNKDDKVEISSRYGEYTFYNQIENAEDGVKIISTLVREYALSMASDIVGVVSDCPDTDIAEINAIMDTNTNMFGFKPVDYKTTMINLLENELEKLKDTKHAL